MILQRPDLGSPDSRLADWLELLAMSQRERAFGGGELLKILRMEGEHRASRLVFSEVTGDSLEGEIAGEEGQEIVRTVFLELQRRANALGASYPFLVESVGTGVSSRQRLRWKDSALDHSGSVVYCYCLIISALRLALLRTSDADDEGVAPDGNKVHSDHRYGLLMQICAALALGGYLHGEVVSFGYPRPDKTNFLAGHELAWSRFGAYKPVKSVPIGAPDSENDAGIDLIGWLNFADQYCSKVLVIGQVASGADWINKSVKDSIDALATWFEGPSFKHSLPAMVMPFNITDARKTIKRGPTDMRGKVLEIEERKFGIVLDRERVATCAARALAFDDDSKGRIDRVGDYTAVKQWVETALDNLEEAA